MREMREMREWREKENKRLTDKDGGEEIHPVLLEKSRLWFRELLASTQRVNLLKMVIGCRIKSDNNFKVTIGWRGRTKDLVSDDCHDQMVGKLCTCNNGGLFKVCNSLELSFLQSFKA